MTDLPWFQGTDKTAVGLIWNDVGAVGVFFFFRSFISSSPTALPLILVVFMDLFSAVRLQSID